MYSNKEMTRVLLWHRVNVNKKNEKNKSTQSDENKMFQTDDNTTKKEKNPPQLKYVSMICFCCLSKKLRKNVQTIDFRIEEDTAALNNRMRRIFVANPSFLFENVSKSFLGWKQCALLGILHIWVIKADSGGYFIHNQTEDFGGFYRTALLFFLPCKTH